MGRAFLISGVQPEFYGSSGQSTYLFKFQRVEVIRVVVGAASTKNAQLGTSSFVLFGRHSEAAPTTNGCGTSLSLPAWTIRGSTCTRDLGQTYSHNAFVSGLNFSSDP